MTRRITLIVTFLCAFVALTTCFVGVSTVANAEGEIAPSPVGEDLGEWQVAVEYHAYTLSGNGFYYAFVVTFDNDFFLSSGTVEDAVFSPSPAFDELATLFRQAGYSVAQDGKKDGKLKATFAYDDTVDYYIANGLTGYDNNAKEGETKKGFYFTDYTRTSLTPFATVKTEGRFLNRVLSILTNAGAEEQKIRLTYVYGTPYKIVRTDADNVRYVSGSSLYLHSFDMTADTAADRTLTIYQRSPNPTGWYVTAFLVAVPVIAVPLAILLIRKKHGGTYAR